MACEAKCFPSGALVDVLVDDVVVSTEMRNLRVGDLVRVGGDVFEPVLTFISHFNEAGIVVNDEDIDVDYVVVHTEAGKTIAASRDHYLLAGSSSLGERAFVSAGEILVGVHWVYAKNDAPTNVSNIEVQRMRGAFSPLTPSTTIVVDGVVASCLTTAAKPFLPYRAPLDVGVRFWAWTHGVLPTWAFRAWSAAVNVVLEKTIIGAGREMAVEGTAAHGGVLGEAATGGCDVVGGVAMAS